MNKYLKTIAEKCGVENQSILACEECAELIQALTKYRRVQGHGQKTTLREEIAMVNITEEIADVEIMLEQLKYLYNCEKQVEEWKKIKIERTMDLL